MDSESSKVTVTIRYFAVVRELAGKKDEKVTFPKVTSLLEAISEVSKKHGEKFSAYVLNKDGNLSERLVVLVNGKGVERTELERFMLKNGNTIAILPPVGGGLSGCLYM